MATAQIPATTVAACARAAIKSIHEHKHAERESAIARAMTTRKWLFGPKRTREEAIEFMRLDQDWKWELRMALYMDNRRLREAEHILALAEATGTGYVQLTEGDTWLLQYDPEDEV